MHLRTNSYLSLIKMNYLDPFLSVAILPVY